MAHFEQDRTGLENWHPLPGLTGWLDFKKAQYFKILYLMNWIYEIGKKAKIR